MRKKQISHEVPLSMLSKSLDFNDYQYCLVHLLEKYPKYLDHFKKCKKEGIPVLLDNSLFELGTAFSPERFIKWVEELEPEEYIIPDAFDDRRATVKNAAEWMSNHMDVPGKKIGVIQGRDYYDYVACYKSLDALGVDKIAISFGYPSYTRENPHIDKNQARMFGRVTLINRLLNDGIINTEKPHHLLGASLPQEFMFYKDERFDFIESLDTSNPIAQAILGIEYAEGGLIHKNEVKMNDMMDKEIHLNLSMGHNLKMFRALVNEPEWRPVVGYEDFYEVSDQGDIRSLDKERISNLTGTLTTYPGKILKASKTNNGYLHVQLFKEKKGTHCLVHRIVAEAFCEKDSKATLVRHLDDNPQNNCKWNLSWGTSKDNTEDMLEKSRQASGSKNGSAKLTEEDVLEIRRLRDEEDKTYKSLAKQFSVTTHVIGNICKRRSWTHI